MHDLVQLAGDATATAFGRTDAGGPNRFTLPGRTGFIATYIND